MKIKKAVSFVALYASFIYWFFIFKTIGPYEGWVTFFINARNYGQFNNMIRNQTLFTVLFSGLDVRCSIACHIILILVIILAFLYIKELITNKASSLTKIIILSIICCIFILSFEFIGLTFLRREIDFTISYLISLFSSIYLLYLYMKEKKQ